MAPIVTRERPANIDRVFGYGTLKTGECRAHAWPYEPSRIGVGSVQGQLYDLGSHPAMIPGADTVVGQVWSFELEQMSRTLQVLDEIEGFRNREDDLYRREIVLCTEQRRNVTQAYAYFYRHDLNQDQRVLPDTDGRCVWVSK